MIRKVAFTMYPVHDVPRARAFYEEVLGLQVGMNGGRDGVSWVEYDLPGGGCFAITNAGNGEPSRSAGGTIAFEVDDLDALVASLESRGVPLLGGIVRGPRCRMVVCVDPEGNSVLLHQLDQASGALGSGSSGH